MRPQSPGGFLRISVGAQSRLPGYKMNNSLCNLVLDRPDVFSHDANDAEKRFQVSGVNAVNELLFPGKYDPEDVLCSVHSPITKTCSPT